METVNENAATRTCKRQSCVHSIARLNSTCYEVKISYHCVFAFLLWTLAFTAPGNHSSLPVTYLDHIVDQRRAFTFYESVIFTTVYDFWGTMRFIIPCIAHAKVFRVPNHYIEKNIACVFFCRRWHFLIPRTVIIDWTLRILIDLINTIAMSMYIFFPYCESFSAAWSCIFPT